MGVKSGREFVGGGRLSFIIESVEINKKWKKRKRRECTSAVYCPSFDLKISSMYVQVYSNLLFLGATTELCGRISVNIKLSKKEESLD